MMIFRLRRPRPGPGIACAGVRARILAVTAVAAMVVATLGLAGGTAGVARAAAAGARPGAWIGAARLPAGAQGCFDTFPNCTSTDPSVEFTIVNSGDTSSCTFKFTVDWGDKHSDTQTFPGSPNDGVIATFDHTYDKKMPQTWTITVTGEVLSNTNPSITCTATGSTLMFTLLPELGVGAVRFSPLAGQSDNTTPGLPVIKDDGPSVTMDDQWGPTSCGDIISPRKYDYLDCRKPVPSGSPAKIWPVIYAKGDALTIDQVVFAANGQVPDPQLTATASISGSARVSLRLPATALSQAKAGSGYLLTANSLTFTGALPDVPGRDKLTIKWTVTDLSSGLKVQTVTSSHVIYMTAGKYAAPGGVQHSDEKPYVTVLDTGIVAASGVSGKRNVFDAIWRKFTTLTIKHPILDPATGFVSDGNAMTYYNDGFTTLSDGFNRDRNGCTDLLGMLHLDSGHCGAWAAFFAMVMAFQGVTARRAGLGRETGPGGFQAGPAPSSRCSAAVCDYMLVGPKLWHFKHATGGGVYRFRDKLTVTRSGAIDITGNEITYSSRSAIAQGPVSTPPMWYTDGDHAIDEVTLPGRKVWVDPSYGDPMPPLTPFANIKTYEPHALAGFAVVYIKIGTKLVPLRSTYDERALAATCRHATCYFQAFKGSS